MDVVKILSAKLNVEYAFGVINQRAIKKTVHIWLDKYEQNLQWFKFIYHINSYKKTISFVSISCFVSYY